MKKITNYFPLIATGLFSYLFYCQSAGVNYLIFSNVIICLLLLKDRTLIKNKKWCWAVGLVIISAVSVVIHSSTLSVVSNIVCLILLAGISFNQQTSALFSFLLSCTSLIMSYPSALNDFFTASNKTDGFQKRQVHSVIGIAATIIIIIVFFFLYKTINPLFAENTKWINFDFISIEWVFLTIVGLFIGYAIFNYTSINFIESWENSLTLQLHKNDNNLFDASARLAIEKLIVIASFIVLNVMLLILNMGDINTLILHKQLPSGITHASFVHSAIGALIFSILLAISLIMYFLRGELNFLKGSRLYKSLILMWIVQNIIMLLSTTYRNHLYITEYTLTHKRIGVYVWISLAAIGLILTAIKLHFNKTNWYLLRTNVAVWFTVLSMSSTIDWDLVIVRYNIKHTSYKYLDINYLMTMSNTVLPELIKFEKRFNDDDIYKDSYYRNHFIMPFIHQIKNDDWRSWNLKDERIIEAITNK